jgi:hypothetical protein
MALVDLNDQITSQVRQAASSLCRANARHHWSNRADRASSRVGSTDPASSRGIN